MIFFVDLATLEVRRAVVVDAQGNPFDYLPVTRR
jgi:hypothetical protein